MADTQDRVAILYRKLRASTRDAFLCQAMLAELSEQELQVLEQICEKYRLKELQVSPVLV